MNEHALQNTLRLALAKVGPFFRANVGSGWVGKVLRRHGQTVTLSDARTFSTGLPRGFSDLFGITPVVITPEMVGTTVGVFTALEVKSPTGKVSKEQSQFIQAVRKNGGIAGVVRSVDDLSSLIGHKSS